MDGTRLKLEKNGTSGSIVVHAHSGALNASTSQATLRLSVPRVLRMEGKRDAPVSLCRFSGMLDERKPFPESQVVAGRHPLLETALDEVTAEPSTAEILSGCPKRAACWAGRLVAGGQGVSKRPGGVW